MPGMAIQALNYDARGSSLANEGSPGGGGELASASLSVGRVNLHFLVCGSSITAVKHSGTCCACWNQNSISQRCLNGRLSASSLWGSSGRGENWSPPLPLCWIRTASAQGPMLHEGRSLGASGMETTLPSVGATDAQAQFLAGAEAALASQAKWWGISGDWQLLELEHLGRKWCSACNVFWASEKKQSHKPIHGRA